ncbi:MAG: hypothetical protein IJ040_02690 [Lachnospiraceae bacterium]|nr:hypothetical protein [Lachnospiraceae bacterium]
MIRPVEMQMILPQANQVGMQQHNANQHASVQSAQGANQLAKEVKESAETIIPKEDPDLMEYRYDAKEKGNNTYDEQFLKRRKKREESEAKEKEKQHSKPEGGWVNFDIKV